MVYDCSDEFDLKKIYQKLTGTVPKVKASKFFEKHDELELLQTKMNGISFAESTYAGYGN